MTANRLATLVKRMRASQKDALVARPTSASLDERVKLEKTVDEAVEGVLDDQPRLPATCESDDWERRQG